MPRLLFASVGMFVAGALALAGVGVLYRERVTRPFPVHLDQARAGVSSRTPDSGGPPAVAVALDGIRADLEFFASALERGDRGDAVTALDGAYRASDVIQGAVGPDGGAGNLFDRVMTVRELVQGGRAEQAAALARQTADLAHPMRGASAAPPADPEQYIGALVIGPAGDVHGTIEAVDAGTVTVRLGAVKGLLGFASLAPGETRHVPIDAMVFGEARRFGMTMAIDSTPPARQVRR